MATQVNPVGGTLARTVVARPARPVRARSDVEPALRAMIRWGLVVLLLVLGLCGMAAATSVAAGTTPPEGPVAGLDL
jgi:hypothetical protein